MVKNLFIARIVYCLLTVNLIYLLTSCRDESIDRNPAHRIIIEASMTNDWLYKYFKYTGNPDKLTIEYWPAESVSFDPDRQTVKATVNYKKKIATWLIYSPEPISVYFAPSALRLVNPGDSIHIDFPGKDPVFTGKGADKLNTWQNLKIMDKTNKTPTKESYIISSLVDYLHWSYYLDSLLKIKIPLIDSASHAMSSTEYAYLKADMVNAIELNRLRAFEALLKGSANKRIEGVSQSDLCAIWDSTQYTFTARWLRTQTDYKGSVYSFNLFNELETDRRFGFDLQQDSLRARDKRNYLYYTSAKEKYVGLLRERIMAYMMMQAIVPKMDTSNAIRKWILSDYYAQPGYPEYKEMIKAMQKRKG